MLAARRNFERTWPQWIWKQKEAEELDYYRGIAKQK